MAYAEDGGAPAGTDSVRVFLVGGTRHGTYINLPNAEDDYVMTEAVTTGRIDHYLETRYSYWKTLGDQVIFEHEILKLPDHHFLPSSLKATSENLEKAREDVAGLRKDNARQAEALDRYMEQDNENAESRVRAVKFLGIARDMLAEAEEAVQRVP